MASKELEGFGSSLGKLGGLGKLAAVGMAGVAAGAVGLVAGLGSSITQAMDFEAAMSAVGAVAGASDEQMQALSDTALKLGQDTTLSGIGATDAARAMRELAAAGLSVDQIVGGAAVGALRLASAGGIDVAQAAELAAQALANFGLTGEDTTRVADLFASAANSSAISITDIGETMKYVGPVAKSMGLSIEETTAAIAAMGNQGIKGSQAGTALRSMMVSLAKPSKEATKVINGLGLSFFDTNGQMKNIAGISEELKTKMSGLTDQQRASALATLFGNEALTAATVLYGEGADGINKWLKEVTTGATAAEVGAKRNDNLKGSLEALKSSLQTGAIVLGQAFLPALKGLTDQAALAVSAAIPLIEAWGPKLVAGIQSAIGVITQFGGYVASAIGAVVGAFKELQAGQITLAQFVGGVKSLIGTVLGDLGGMLGKAAEFVAPYLAAIGQAIVAALPFIGQALGQVASLFGGWIQGTAIPYLQANLPLWLAALAGWISGTAAPAVSAAIVAVATAFGGWITGTAIPYLQANLPAWLDAITGWITGTALPAITAAVTGLAAALVSWIRGEDATTAFGGWSGAVVQALANVVGLLTEFGAIAGPKLVEWIKSEETQAKFGELLAAVGSGTADVLNALDDFSSQAGVRAHQWLMDSGPLWLHDWGELARVTGEGIAAISAALDAWEQEQVGKLGAWLGELAARFGEWVNTAGPAWLHSWSELGRVMSEQLANMAAAAGQAMSNLGSTINGALAGIAGAAGAAAAAIGNAIIQGIAGALSAGAGALAGIAAGVVQGALDAAKGALGIKSPSKEFAYVGEMAVQGLIEGMDAKQGEAAAKAASVASAVAKAATDILGAIGALSAFDFAKNSPTGETLGWFRHLAESLVTTLAEIAALVGGPALDSAKKVGESVGQVGSAVKSTLEAFKALSEYDFAKNSPNGDMLGWFRHLVESIVLNFAQAAQLVGTEGMTKAQEFAKASSDVVAAAKATLELFKSLEAVKDIPAKALNAMWTALEDALIAMDNLVSRSDAIKQAALDYLANMQAAFAASQQASSIGVSVGGATPDLPNFVDQFAQLPNMFGGVPALAAGGIVTKPTLALVGEAGPEAIVPLGGRGGGRAGGPVYHITIPGNIYGMADFEGAVIGAIETARRRGRTA